MNNISILRSALTATAGRRIAAQLSMQLQQALADDERRAPPPIAPQELTDCRLTARHTARQRLLSEASSKQLLGDFFGIHEQLLHMYFELPIPMYLDHLLQS